MAKFSINTEALISLRGKDGLRLKDVAEKAEISESYLSEIENGRKVPRPDVAKRIAKALSVPLGAFFVVGTLESSELVEDVS